MDPWYEGAILCNSFFLYPPPRRSGREVARDTRALYISHIHPDHFSPATLEHFDRAIPVYIGEYRLKGFRDRVRELGFPVQEVPFQTRVRLDGLDATIAILESDYEETAAYDSSIVIETPQFTVFNNNDCFLRDDKVEWVRDNFSTDYAFIGFSPASFYYPASFEFEPGLMERLLAEAAERRYADFLRVAGILRPRISVPFASGVRFLHAELLWKNRCFNSAPEAVRRARCAGLRAEVMGPGDCIMASGGVRRVSPVLEQDEELRSIEQYARERASDLEDLWREEGGVRADLVDRFRRHVLSLWSRYEHVLADVRDTVIAYRLTGIEGGSFYFDFSREPGSIFNAGEPAAYDMRYTYPAHLVQGLLDGRMDWDELNSSGRVSIDQKRFARGYYAMLRSAVNPPDKILVP